MADTTLAIIGGSQGFRFLKDMERLGPVDTPYGQSQAVYKVTRDGLTFLYMSRHGEKGYSVSAPFVNYRANIWALKECGVGKIISWSGPAAIDPGISMGEILVPGDIIDETRARPSTFYAGTGLGFIRQNPVFCPHLSQALQQAITNRFGKCRSEDVYVCTEGPRLETPSEIRKYALYGATLVGMTLVPEVFLAKELEICYAAICYTTNYAEGIRKREFKPGVLFEGLLDEGESQAVENAVAALPDIALDAMKISRDIERNCRCSRLMERYRRRGDIGDDWHEWVR